MFAKVVKHVCKDCSSSNLEEKGELGKLVELKRSMMTLTLYNQCMILSRHRAWRKDSIDQLVIEEGPSEENEESLEIAAKTDQQPAQQSDKNQKSGSAVSNNGAQKTYYKSCNNWAEH